MPATVSDVGNIAENNTDSSPVLMGLDSSVCMGEAGGWIINE